MANIYIGGTPRLQIAIIHNDDRSLQHLWNSTSARGLFSARFRLDTEKTLNSDQVQARRASEWFVRAWLVPERLGAVASMRLVQSNPSLALWACIAPGICKSLQYNNAQSTLQHW